MTKAAHAAAPPMAPIHLTRRLNRTVPSCCGACIGSSCYPGAELSLDDLREFCTGQIAHFKIPRYLRITEDFPMTVTGKVQKFVMREVSIGELDLGEADRTPTA